MDVWDDLAFDAVEIGAETIQVADVNSSTSEDITSPASTNSGQSIMIEEQIIVLPSNGNTSHVHRELELSHRVSIAEEQLNHIRNLIAEKSFQFSHVIRVSPRKGVATRARALVKRLNNQIAEHCRMYARCRSCMDILGAEDSILSKFQILKPVDIAGSTVVLNPNEPGSTGIKLSWIWQTSARHFLTFSDAEVSADDPASLLECVFLLFGSFLILKFHSVRRVHWLRARAQKMRWQEEVTLTTHEMQWTVRYFSYKSKNWSKILDTSAEHLGASTGALAYAKRKQSTWHILSLKSDRTFTVINNAYKSPL